VTPVGQQIVGYSGQHEYPAGQSELEHSCLLNNSAPGKESARTPFTEEA